NRRVVEALIKSGAFDSTGYTRMQMMHFVDKNNPENIIDAAAKRQKDRAAGQSSLFDLFVYVAGSGFESDVPPADGIEWDRTVKLAQEHEVLGIYVSDHPLRPYEYALSKARDYLISDIEVSEEYVNPATGTTSTRYKVPEGKPIHLAGMVTSVAKKTTKNGDNMAIVTLEDMEGEITLVVFPKLYKQCAATLAGEIDQETGETVGNVFVRVSGKLERSDRGNQIICQDVTPMELSDRTNKPKVFEVFMTPRMLTYERMQRLNSIFGRYGGMDRVELLVQEATGTTMRMELPCRVDARNVLLKAEVVDLVGQEGHVAYA
ncbi:MAG: DNA polymerase III subunit alpha, partial [Atopobiaceae bacterium]|nr:DNA polymerase III subunit alpha [Atopobiaceae bacterium]